ncbi:HEPN/Toprim-associated domain-containing protein [Lutibacter sp.]|uniref:HEPN/Toprim-associated domain-containing protein n=1 Tax=Lutibacter sp. TaxID=1925666 RepID=UPI0025C2A1C5|nr:HEPN/Toprim-associated domain-containing protein [Lutibacter sp.]MCF6169054.1 hypothetical protein [Lutibacter sp.]
MGTFCELSINDYDLFDIKNGYQKEIIDLIFNKSDFIIEKEIGNDYVSKKFVSKVSICKKRLEIYGNTLHKSKIDFTNSLKKYKAEYDVVFDNEDEISYKLYQQIIKRNIESKLRIYDECDNPISENFEEFIKSNNFGVPYQSLECLLWSIFDSIDQDYNVVYDLTNIIESGWITSNPEKEIEIQKIIILTEGKTDTEFIKKGLNIFYPFLKEHYHFMDFENSNYESSASRLVQTVKAFVGSGIKNRIIALFDNDTAGTKEINNLKKTKLPDNIKVFKYPKNDLAKDYPTQGPNGLIQMDVNNLGCSIEMYLGKKSLKLEDKYQPVQWKGYDEKLEQYQGEVRNKKKIQEYFRNQIKEKRITSENAQNEIPELKKIVDLILNAWHNNDTTTPYKINA